MILRTGNPVLWPLSINPKHNAARPVLSRWRGMMPAGGRIGLAWVFNHAFVALLIVWGIMVVSPTGLAASTDADRCVLSAHRAAQRTGVPATILLAVSLVETGRGKGRDRRPWPWTVNLKGKGFWFASRNEAERFARRTLGNGQRLFDVGCFQINYRWHGNEFSSISSMFEPDTNALYAARFLKRLYREKGNWMAAVGAYHSRDKKRASRYAARFIRILNTLPTENPAGPRLAQGKLVSEPALHEATNNYPLLSVARQAHAARGSLVFLDDHTVGALIE